MHARHLLAVVAFALAACGPEDYVPPTGTSPVPTPKPTVDVNFSGRWVGVTTLSSPGQSPFAYNSSVDLGASGETLTVRAFCPDSTGLITATGKGRSVEWSGDVTCASVSTSCPSALLHYTRATATLVSDNAINLTGEGFIAGCGASVSITSVFRGSK